jgi:hypothetical protein
MATELVMARVAASLDVPVLRVQEKNFYKAGQKTPYGQVPPSFPPSLPPSLSRYLAPFLFSSLPPFTFPSLSGLRVA